MSVEFWYFNLGGHEARAMEEDDGNDQLVEQVDEREVGCGVQHRFVASRHFRSALDASTNGSKPRVDLHEDHLCVERETIRIRFTGQGGEANVR